VRVRYRGGRGYVSKSHITRERQLEIYFIDVDQGDAILIQTPDDRRILIDGGASNEAHRFIRNKYRLEDDDNFIDFDAIVATHSDEDHTKGLIPILKDPKIAVKRFFHNGLFRRKSSASDPGSRSHGRVRGLVDRPALTDKPELKALMQRLVKAIDQAEQNLPDVIEAMLEQERWQGRLDMPEGGFVCRRLDASDRYLPPFGKSYPYLKIDLLWPAEKNGTLPWYDDAGRTVNGNSIVLRVRHGKNSVLLTGDLNDDSMDDIVKLHGKKGRLRADVYKAAHHGSQDFTIDFIQKVSPSAVVISSGDDRNDRHGHPRAVLLGTATRYARKGTKRPAVFSTELAACFRRLSTKEQKAFDAYEGQLYERSIKGIVHLRSDGTNLLLGTVHGRKAPPDELAGTTWKWDVWTREIGKQS
jgi:beta-lactamase superfamily II metal-dependent hydrolase